MKSIEINGKEYAIRFSTRALINFEQSSGLTVASLEDKANHKLDVLVKLAYSGLVDGARKNKKKLSQSEDIDWLIDAIDDEPSLLADLVKAFSNSQNVDKAKKPKRR